MVKNSVSHSHGVLVKNSVSHSHGVLVKNSVSFSIKGINDMLFNWEVVTNL